MLEVYRVHVKDHFVAIKERWMNEEALVEAFMLSYPLCICLPVKQRRVVRDALLAATYDIVVSIREKNYVPTFYYG